MEKSVLKKEDVIININLENDNPVDARELHKALEVGRDFTTWIKGRISEYSFIENEDFEVFTNLGENPIGGRPTKEFAVKMDMAKELAMVEKTEKGRIVRRYFIETEKEYRKLVKVLTSSEYDAFYLRFLKLLEKAEDKVKTKRKLAEMLGISVKAYYLLKNSPHKAKVSGILIMKTERKLMEITGEDLKKDKISPDKMLNLMTDIVRIKDENLRLSITDKLMN